MPSYLNNFQVLITILFIFWKNKSRVMISTCCLCVWESPLSVFKAWANLYKIWCTLAPEPILLHKSRSSVFVPVCKSLLSLLGNGLVNTFPWQRIHATIELLNASFSMRSIYVLSKVTLWVCLFIPLLLLGNNYLKMFPRQRKIVGGVVFYTVHVISKESMRWILPRTSCSAIVLQLLTV
jgi:hypothetical protein